MWAVDSSLRNVFALSAADLVIQSGLDLDQLLMTRQRSARSSFHEREKRAAIDTYPPGPYIFIDTIDTCHTKADKSI
jgi:hypothetical protein